MYYNVVTPVIFLKYLNIQALSPPSPLPLLPPFQNTLNILEQINEGWMKE